MPQSKNYEAGTVMLNSGEMGTGFYILKSGTIEIFRENRVVHEILTGVVY